MMGQPLVGKPAPTPEPAPTLVLPGYSHEAFSLRTHTRPMPKHQHGDKVPQTDLPLVLHHLQCLMDIPASASSSSRQRCFLDCSAASLHSFLAAALALAASASQCASLIHSLCFHHSRASIPC